MSKKHKKTVLVTGSEGSLMSFVIPRLIENGYDVVGMDNLCRYGKKNPRLDSYRNDFDDNEEEFIIRGYDFYGWDCTNTYDVKHMFEEYKFDYVIQGAALIYGVRGFDKHAADILGDDITIHRNILNSAKDNGVKKVVFTSSSMVYETVDDKPSVKETRVDGCVTPKTDYGLSKLAAERLSIAYQKQYGLPYTIWRPFNIITPFEEAEGHMGDSHVFADFIDQIMIKKCVTLPILGDGKQIRCFTWIEEVANAIADNLDNPKTDNEIFNVGNFEPVTMKQLAQEIHTQCKEMGYIPSDMPLVFDHHDAPPNDVRYRAPNVTKIKDELGWEAKVKLQESVKRCLQAPDLIAKMKNHK